MAIGLNVLKENNTAYVEEFDLTPRSHFLSALDITLENNKLYKEKINTLYTSIAEAESEEAVNESFTKFFDSVKEIIDNTIKYTSSEFSDFCTSLTKATSKDKFISDKKDLFMNFKSDKYPTMDLYKFTKLDSGIPKKVIKIHYEEEYDKLQKILSSRSMNISEKINKFIELQRSVIEEINEGFYDKFRSKILGLNNPVSRIEFSNILFSIFRTDGQKIPTVIDQSYVKETYNRFTNVKNIVKTLKIEKATIDREYNGIKNDIKNIKFDQLMTSFGPGTLELESKFDVYIKIKVDQIINLTNDYTLAYMAKLDAISSCYIQDRNVLISCMNIGGEL